MGAPNRRQYRLRTLDPESDSRKPSSFPVFVVSNSSLRAEFAGGSCRQLETVLQRSSVILSALEGCTHAPGRQLCRKRRPERDCDVRTQSLPPSARCDDRQALITLRPCVMTSLLQAGALSRSCGVAGPFRQQWFKSSGSRARVFAAPRDRAAAVRGPQRSSVSDRGKWADCRAVFRVQQPTSAGCCCRMLQISKRQALQFLC